MNNYFKALVLIVVFPPLTLLTGCNSEGGFSSQPQPQIDATVFEITVTPSPISVLEGQQQQLVAMAKYDDGAESDVSDSVTWEIVGDPTVASISASGLVTGNTKGDTELIAKKDGITSDTVNVTVCDDLAGPCIDIFDTGSGKLFTSSPSVAYLDSIGGSATNGIESQTYNPIGDFYRFDWDNANRLCDTYNAHNLGGRTNWRLATKNELIDELFHGDMFINRGWPTHLYTFSETPVGDSDYYEHYVAVHLSNGHPASYGRNNVLYASCVSNP